MDVMAIAQSYQCDPVILKRTSRGETETKVPSTPHSLMPSPGTTPASTPKASKNSAQPLPNLSMDTSSYVEAFSQPSGPGHPGTPTSFISLLDRYMDPSPQEIEAALTEAAVVMVAGKAESVVEKEVQQVPSVKAVVESGLASAEADPPVASSLRRVKRMGGYFEEVEKVSDGKEALLQAKKDAGKEADDIKKAVGPISTPSVPAEKDLVLVVEAEKKGKGKKRRPSLIKRLFGLAKRKSGDVGKEAAVEAPVRPVLVSSRRHEHGIEG
ncbi:hypothetical protein HDU67_001672 [Dinochytrium kinnereticum]|nr:hypothetical protein HDU67_001672 [Dinochytrium kinnereticum]